MDTIGDNTDDELSDSDEEYLSEFSRDEKNYYTEIVLNILLKKNNLDEINIEGLDVNKQFQFDKLSSTLNFNYLVDSNTYLLVLASYFNNEKVFKFLLENGADVNLYETVYDNTPIMFSIQSGYDSITDMILKTKKYDHTFENTYGRTLLFHTFHAGYKKWKTKWSYSKLFIEVCKYIIESKGYLGERDNDYNKTVLELLKDECIKIQYYKTYYNSINYKESVYKMIFFLENHNDNFKEHLFCKYPSRLKNNIITILLINNRENNEYYLPIEIWLYIFKFIKIIDYY